MNKHKEAIVITNELAQTLHLYDSIGYEESGSFTSAALGILAHTDDVKEGIQEIKGRFLDSINYLELRRGDWLNASTPARIAKVVEYAKGDKFSLPKG